MGSGSWSDNDYHSREIDRKTKGVSAFAYSDDTTRNTPREKWAVHPLLDPKGVNRESRDSTNHPESLSIAIKFDVTGSMLECPKIFQKGLPKLLGLLLQKRWVDHPQILFGAVGDATCDKVPLQIGQFESDITMEDTLTRFLLEGGGGGQGTESYELAIYMAARHFSADCWEKRGKKGYLFLTGDELPHPHVKPAEVKLLIGDEIAENIATKEIIREAGEKYHIFMIRPVSTQWGTNQDVQRRWETLLGKGYVIKLEHAQAITEMIALIIGLTEGKITLEEGIREIKNLGEATLPPDAIEALNRSLGVVPVTPKGTVKSQNKTSAPPEDETKKKKPGRI